MLRGVIEYGRVDCIGCSACEDLSPMLGEFIRQVRHRTDVAYEARERGFIQKLNPAAFESRHSE